MVVSWTGIHTWVADWTPETVGGAVGAFHLKLPVGAAPYRMPKNLLIPPDVEPWYVAYPKFTCGD